MLINYKTQLFNYLQLAVEVEHSTIPPYLAALFTIDQDTNMASYNVIRSVVMEEMLHMTLACNVLNAVGGAPAIDQPQFVPEYPLELNFSGREFPVNLERFSPDAIETFLKIEQPAELLKTSKVADLSLEAIPQVDIPGLTIGEFYALIEAYLKLLVAEFGEAAIFTGDPARQIGPEHYYGAGGEVILVTDLDSALAAMDLIVEQGEGSDTSIFDGDHTEFGQPAEVAHYFRFNEIAQGRYYAPSDLPTDPPSGPPLERDYGAAIPMVLNPNAFQFKPGSPAAELATDFNNLYSHFLQLLHATFNGSPALLREGVAMMWQMKYAAEALLRTPLPSGEFAGPPFQYVAPSLRRVPAAASRSAPRQH